MSKRLRSQFIEIGNTYLVNVNILFVTIFILFHIFSSFHSRPMGYEGRSVVLTNLLQEKIGVSDIEKTTGTDLRTCILHTAKNEQLVLLPTLFIVVNNIVYRIYSFERRPRLSAAPE